jgi:predicted RNA-binding protein with PUA-like domain
MINILKKPKKWLMKSEPLTFSIDDLAERKNQQEFWDGVRNYQARNMMRDEMKIGDLAFFYHSNCKVPGIAGVIKIIETGLPDLTALDPTSQYFDPKATPENPRWIGVRVQLIEKFDHIISLAQIRAHPLLASMMIRRPGNRLSITPVSDQEWEILEGLKGE